MRPGVHVVEPLERRVFLDAAPVGPSFVVNDVREGRQMTPAVAADAAGNFVVVWEDRGSVTMGRFDAGGNPRGPQLVLGQGERPAVAMDADGDFVVAWHAGEVPSIRAALFSAAGIGRSLGDVPTTNNFGPDTTPDVAMSPGGDFVITWTADYPRDGWEVWGRKSRVYGRLYDARGEARGGDFRVSTVEHTSDARLRSAVAMDADGNFVVTWYQILPTGPWELMTRRYTAAGEPLEEPGVIDRGLFPLTAPGVAMDADGDFVVLWQKGGETSGEWFWRRYDNARGNWGDPTALDPGDPGGAYFPAIDMDADGNFSIAWTQGVGFDVFVYAQCYTPAGQKSGGRIVVESQSHDDPVQPAVAVDEEGGLVVAFDQWSGARSYDVKARRYTGAAVPQPPTVTGVFVNGTAWSPRFRYGLESRGLGPRRWGFAVPGGPAQGQPLPWVNLNQVSVRFDRDVTVAADALAVTGAAGGTYGFAAAAEGPAFSYDAATRTATWTLGRPVGAERLTLSLKSGAGGVRRAAGGRALDGEWLGSLDTWPSGDGAEGGDFELAVNVLPGDTSRDGRVTAADVVAVRSARWAEADDPAAPADVIFRAVNGSYRVTVADELLVRRRVGRAFPPAGAGAVQSSATHVLGVPPRRQLYALRPIL